MATNGAVDVREFLLVSSADRSSPHVSISMDWALIGEPN